MLRFLKENPCMGKIHYLGKTFLFQENTKFLATEILLPNDYQKTCVNNWKTKFSIIFLLFYFMLKTKQSLNLKNTAYFW